MSDSLCGFTLRHYGDILERAREIGYIFSTFAQPPDEGLRIYLRHDVDVLPENSLEIAKLEHQAGVASTFFLMSSSPFYNLLEISTLAIFREISELGHQIGLHIDERVSPINVDLAEGIRIDEYFRFFIAFLPIQPVISFHMPTNAVLNLSTGTYVNAYSPPFFADIKYISDSRRRWREGCLCRWLEKNELRSLQVLTHPVWWNERELGIHQVYTELGARTDKALFANFDVLTGFGLPGA